MLVVTLELNDELNHKMFLPRFLLLGGRDVNLIFSLKPLFLSALSQSGTAISKYSLSHVILDILLLIMAGICLMRDGGWFDCLRIYNNSLTSRYGQYFQLSKNVDHHGWPKIKNRKKWLKPSKAVLKSEIWTKNK